MENAVNCDKLFADTDIFVIVTSSMCEYILILEKVVNCSLFILQLWFKYKHGRISLFQILDLLIYTYCCIQIMVFYKNIPFRTFLYALFKPLASRQNPEYYTLLQF